jgi:predicted SprT family Zn-dependent metalloprotease
VKDDGQSVGERRPLKIVRGNLRIEPEFYEKIRASVMMTHELLIKADLATPEIREYLNECRVLLSARMVSSAGVARWKLQCIVLNVRLLALYPDALPTTVVHEVCHLLAAKLYGDHGHGKQWKQLMVTLGYEPRRCHTLDPSGLNIRARNGSTDLGSARRC